MRKVVGDRAYPFCHQHTNLFPPPTPDRPPLGTCYEELDEDEDAEIPMLYYSLLIQTPPKIPYVSAVLELSTPPPFTFDMGRPPTLSSTAPANLTGLLQDVLGIMNTIMDSRAEVGEEDAILQELTELVVIMQEEAEMLVEVRDLMEEYCEGMEVEVEVREMEVWCFELGIGNEDGLNKETEVKRLGHGRGDSGRGLDDYDDGNLLGEKFEGGDFVDDRSLEEMKAPS
jgi:hypothetical protein